LTKLSSGKKTATGTRRFGMTRRQFSASSFAVFGVYGIAGAAEYSILRSSKSFSFPETGSGVIEQVIPNAGVPTGVAFKEPIQRLITGVVDPVKFRASSNKMPAWVERQLRAPSEDPIVFSHETAPHLVNLLWPIGLSNKAAFNENSPINTLSIPSFASTGGWVLGRQQNGYVYFNQVEAVSMTAHQQAMVLAIARTTYRPCCNNSTLYQNCNHGSALLGLLELAAAQGTTLKGLYGLALTANSHWFPDNYAKTALYFSHFHGKSWRDLEPKLILSAALSSGTWETNVNSRLRRANVALPGISIGQQRC
jgi:hypothetical protein